ncbi:HEPN domain-containing protein [Thermococcus argininiproducens]|uniref:HEPN domain-containing protein n=1 Tax=Thermococcus argininiproducens TaxID=2866384 RepID=A0A9E7MBL9_9EURY|nr:HEPN domain-containing protein [Thermococcus argininiproducens]USH00498.1 HEPN domain-containing protein [Thermococcus argininiproducens]
MNKFKALINKAEKSLKASQELLTKGFYDFAAARAYYTMFYCAEAILLTKNITVSKHSSLIALFGKELVKTGEVPYRLYTHLIMGFNLRHEADYEVMLEIPKERAKEIVKFSKEFIDFTKAYLAEKGFLEEI